MDLPLEILAGGLPKKFVVLNIENMGAPRVPFPQAPSTLLTRPIPTLQFGLICPSGFRPALPGPINEATQCVASQCPDGYTEVGMICQKPGQMFITKETRSPTRNPTVLTPLIGSSNTPANATPKQQAAYASYRDLNASVTKMQTDYDNAVKNFNSEVKRCQDLRADLDNLYNLACAAAVQAGTLDKPAPPQSVMDKANAAMNDYGKAFRTIQLLIGYPFGSRTDSNNSLAKASLDDLKTNIEPVYYTLEANKQRLNDAVAAIAKANTEAAEAAARNAKSKNDAEKAKVAQQLAAAQAALAASASAAVASGAAAARTASAAAAAWTASAAAAARTASAAAADRTASAAAAARTASAAAAARTASAAAARAANMTTITREEVRAGQRQISKQSSNPNSSGKCPNDMMLLDGKCWTKCPAGFIDSGLFCVEMTQGGLQQQPAVLAPVKNTPKKTSNLVKENIEILKTHAAMLGGYGKKGRSTRHSKKGVRPRKKRNSGKKTYRRKF